MSVITKNQKKHFEKTYTEGGVTYRIIATVRHDDDCGNGHNSFSITGTLYQQDSRGGWFDIRGGCIHEDITKQFPELAPLIKWHLCSTDGPLHYVANTVFLVGDKDHWGLRAGEFQQFTDRETKLPLWKVAYKHEDKIACATKPEPVLLYWEPYGRMGEGKVRDLDGARRTAIWPEATDAELCDDGLAERLTARLPGLLAEFQSAVESLGLVY